MDCKCAANLMMKFMDNAITKKDMANLEAHVAECETCKDDLVLYSELLNDFAAMEIVTAPDGFELSVMETIESMPRAFRTTMMFENIACFIGGFASVFVGLAMILALNKENIVNLIAQNRELSMFAAIHQTIAVYAEKFLVSISATASWLFDGSIFVLGSFRFILLPLLVIMALLQLMSLRRNSKVKVDA